ncbi:hypothetical protein BH10CYA1_BH10CYA1_62130 [soil metagenome]
MSEIKPPLMLDEMEVSLALHALRFYINAKGAEVSNNTRELEGKFDDFLNDTTFVVSQVESAASIMGARGGIKGGASTSDAKKAAAAANGAKGGRPRKPNLYIRFHRSVWEEPDPKLLKKLSTLAGDYSWLPDQPDDKALGPYVRMYVPAVSDHLSELLSHSMNVIEWDEKPFLRLCDAHKTEPCREISDAEKSKAPGCSYCAETAQWIG